MSLRMRGTTLRRRRMIPGRNGMRMMSGKKPTLTSPGAIILSPGNSPTPWNAVVMSSQRFCQISSKAGTSSWTPAWT